MEKIYVKTFGCSLNYADSERIKAVLISKGFNLVEKEEDANLIILNSCAVKGPTESKFFTLLEKIKKENKKIIVAGCIAQALPEKLKEFSKIGPDQIENISEVVEETLSGNIVSLIVQEPKNKLEIPTIRKKPILEIIPISQGCLGECAYCIVKIARGKLHSYPIKDIINVAKKAVSEGVKEIWLTSQDNGCYGFDINTDLPSLLNEIVKIEGDFKVRVGMMNPNHLMKILNKTIQAYKHPKIYKFLHIPVQSGNNFVLEDMKRKYHVEDFYYICNQFRKEIPEITISTDIIVAYPTEKEEFFVDTLNLIKKAKPNVLNLSRYWPRPKTESSKLKQLPGAVSKERAIKVMSTFNWISFEENKKWLGWEGEILITEKGKNNTMIGRNFAYKSVVIFDKAEIGEKYKVRIIKTMQHDLIGQVISSD